MTKRYKGHVIRRTSRGAYDVYYLGQVVAHGPDLPGAKFWIDHYGKKSNPSRTTKAQKRARASRAAKQRGIVKAVKGLLKKTNPAAKITGASVVKLKGGVLKITPIRQNISVRKTKKLVKGGGGTGFWTGKPGAARLHRIKPKRRKR